MTAPYVLHLGDCLPFLRSLPDKSVDHVITDPPYEAEAHTLQRRVLWNQGSKKVREEAIDFAPISSEIRDASAAEMTRVCRGWILVFCQAEAVFQWRASLELGGSKWRRPMLWIKPDGQPCLAGDRPGMGYESMALAWAGSGRSRWNGGGKCGVYEVATNNFGRLYAEGGRPHPTVKPLALMEALVRDFTDPGETILDPFAGSGTTGVAAIRLGRRFIGCELSPKYHAVATKRLSQAREQMGLWNGAA